MEAFSSFANFYQDVYHHAYDVLIYPFYAYAFFCIVCHGVYFHGMYDLTHNNVYNVVDNTYSNHVYIHHGGGYYKNKPQNDYHNCCDSAVCPNEIHSGERNRLTATA